MRVSQPHDEAVEPDPRDPGDGRPAGAPRPPEPAWAVPGAPAGGTRPDEHGVPDVRRRPDERRPDEQRPDEHRPYEHRPSEHRPSEHRPSEHRPDAHGRYPDEHVVAPAGSVSGAPVETGHQDDGQAVDPDGAPDGGPGRPTATALADPDAGPAAPVGPPGKDELLERLLGRATLALDATRRNRVVGWAWTLGITAIAGVLRFWNLRSPHALVFDETYYVKQGWSLVTRGYEADWGENPNPGFEAGDDSMLGTKAEYFVHPQVGKWLIGLGMKLGGGLESSLSWRLAVAVVGTLSVLLMVRIARRLFASTAWGVVAGAFLALDGLAIVMSRTSLLDPFLMFFALAAFGALLLDREQARRRLAERTADVLAAGGELAFGPWLGMRWWRLVAGVLLGLAIGTKWSGLYFLAVFGLLTVLWDATARRAVGVRMWPVAALVKDAVVAAVVMVGSALLVYVGTWWSWFTHSQSYGRTWADDHPGEGLTFLPGPLRSLVEFHRQMWIFHKDLDSPHTYEAHPLGWIVQWRPTSFYWGDVSNLTGPQAQEACGADHCAQAILAVGNPILWWAGAAAILVALYWLVRYRDWVAGAVLSGLLAGWVPWFAFAKRTIFDFYAIAFTPWVVLTLVYVLTLIVGPPTLPSRERRGAIIGVGVFVGLVVAVGLYFYPIWAGWVVPYEFWHQHIWMRQWV